MDKPILIFIWILSIGGAYFFGNEFGMVEGAQYQKRVNAEKLLSCNKVIMGNLYARDEK